MILSKTRFHLRVAIPLAALLLAAAGVHAQTEMVVMKRASQLREGPGEATRAVAPLPIQTAVVRMGDRQGAWIKVRMSDGTNGWVHMFDITATAASTAGGTGNAGTSALRSLSGFFNKGSAQAQAGSIPTSTLGIRGLGAEDLASAQPNLAALAQANSIRVDATQARQFATASALVTRQVEALPQPTPPAGTPSQGLKQPDQYSR